MPRAFFLCIFYLIMFTSLLYSQNITNTITVLPDNQIVTNMQNINIKKGPLEPDIVKNISFSQNKVFSINLNATNFDRYIRITDFSTNLDFIRFTRDKTNALLTFTTLTPGVAKLNFQVDDENNIIRKYYYTINVTNDIATNVKFNLTETNTLFMLTNSKNTPITNLVITNSIMNMEDIPYISPIKTNGTILEEATDEIISMFNMAEDLKNSKEYDNAVGVYSNIISSSPNTKYGIFSYFRIADIYNYNKDYTNAFDMYKKISALTNINNTQKASAIYSMGVVMKSQNNQNEAISYFSQVLNLYPKTSLALEASYEYADSLKKLGRMSDGVKILEKAIKESSSFNKRPDAILLLAEIYEKGTPNIRDYKKAYELYNQYLKDYSNGSQAEYANNRANFLSRNFINLK